MELLEDVQKAHNDETAFHFKEFESTKTLGHVWVPENDHFVLQLNKQRNKLHKTIVFIRHLQDICPILWITSITTKL